MKEFLIGILMATYNGEKFIKEQLDSILNQTYENWKLIIHDDGSTDLTVDIVKKYAKKHPDRIIFIDDGIKCRGAKENFAHLIRIAKEQFNFNYVMFSDQDDIWLPEKIKITLDKILELEKKCGKDKPILVHTDLKIVDRNLKLIAESFWEYQKIDPLNNSLNCLLLENTVTGCTIMMNEVLLNKIKFDKNVIIHDWWIALICRLNDGIIFPIKQQTILYRQHGKNDTGAKGSSLTRVLIRFLTEPYGFLKRRFDLSLKIRNQIKALYNYYNNNWILVDYIKVERNFWRRKIFYLKNNMLCGNIIKKVGKLIFY